MMFSECLQQHLTVNKDNLQEEPLRAMQVRVQKRLEEQSQQTIPLGGGPSSTHLQQDRVPS
ncbi:MAG: hypothetical protein ACPGCN_16340 [bacterium]